MGDYRKNEENDQLKERTISIRMTDSDLQALASKCGKNGITIKELFEIFVGDLVGGHFCYGSDEGRLADEWFERHLFEYGDDSLLQYLLRYGSATIVGTFLEAWEEQKYFAEHPDELSTICDPSEEPWFIEEIKDDISGWNGEITDEEINRIKAWLEEYSTIKGEEE